MKVFILYLPSLFGEGEMYAILGYYTTRERAEQERAAYHSSQFHTIDAEIRECEADAPFVY